jgi:bifunctional UDP-N-acetylglucosamine pyrophosphorylase/glucosamine-1-phosphate N-acetyltransferase
MVLKCQSMSIHTHTASYSRSVIVLAAGKGTRMKSDLPKVMHHAAGRPMVEAVVDAARSVGCTPVVLVIGHGADLVRAHFAGRANTEFVMQMPQLGTGHAVDMARPLFEKGLLGEETLVLCGDGPLIRPHTLQVLLDTHRNTGASATLATAVIADPQGYGRIQRDSNGNFARIVEQKDASPEQLAICEINPYYCFRTADLFDALKRVTNQNASGEYYITDVFELLLRDGKRVSVVDAVPAEDVLSVNTLEQLAEVSRILESRSSTSTGARA